MYFGIILTTVLYNLSMLNITRFKLKPYEPAFVYVITCVIALLLSFVTYGEMLSNLSTVILMSLFSYSKTKSIRLSLLFSIIATILVIIASNISNGVLRLIAMLPIGGSMFIFMEFAVNFAISFPISNVLGRIIEKRLKMLRSDMKNKAAAYLLFGSIITLLIFYVNVYLINSIDNQTLAGTINTTLLIFYFVYLVVSVISYIVGVHNEMQVKHEQELQSSLKQYTSNIESMYMDMRKFRHDYMNILASIYGYIENEDMDGLKGYFDEHISKVSSEMLSSNNTLDRLHFIEIPELKGLLSVKLLQAHDRKIDARIEITEKISTINMDIVELCRAVGILIDNAVEECINCEKPVLTFAIIKSTEKIKLIIMNTLGNKRLEISKMFEKEYSTKGEGHGMGLYILRQILNKKNNVLLMTEIKGNEFIQELDIYA